MKHFAQGALAGKTKRRVFHIPCEMQRGRDLLSPDYTKERSKRERVLIVLGVGATLQRKENGVKAHSGGFLQTPAHSTLQYANIRPFRPASAKYP